MLDGVDRGGIRSKLFGGVRGTLSSRLWALLPALAAIAFIVNRAAILNAVGAFLVIEEPLAPSAAIFVLAGGTPERETEAAAIYHDGWASRVVLVDAVNAESRRDLLVRLGVPASAIIVAPGTATDTFTELQLAEHATRSYAGPVILVTSKFHARRVRSAWSQIASADHTAIVRVARLDSFDPAIWWRVPSMTRLVTHEYLGLFELAGRSALSSHSFGPLWPLRPASNALSLSELERTPSQPVAAKSH